MGTTSRARPDATSAVVVRAFRQALGWTQARLASEAGFDDDSLISRLETGRNLATSAEVRDGLAKAFGLTAEDMRAYLTGAVKVSVGVRLLKARQAA